MLLIPLLCAILAGAGILIFAVGRGRAAQPLAAEQEKTARMAALRTAAPAPAAGGTLSVLCDRSCAPYFCEESAGTLAARVKNRNLYFELENNAELYVTVEDDVFTAAEKDALSGENAYDLYAADAAGTLSRLLAHGLLADASPLISGKAWADPETTDALRIGGKAYLFSSSILSAISGAAVLRCGKAEMNAWRADVLQGIFTADALREVYGDGWLSPAGTDAAALYTAFGGSFLCGTTEGYSEVSYADFTADTETLRTLYPQGGEVPPAFTVTTLGQISGEDSFLPMPKADAAAPYASYVYLAGIPLCALSRSAVQKDGCAVLLDRFAVLSDLYIRTKVRENVTGNDPDREALYDLVTNSALCDLSALLGYGDIPGLLTAVAEGREPQPALQYYNRIALYEKALSILEKRATASEPKE